MQIVHEQNKMKKILKLDQPYSNKLRNCFDGG